MKKFLIIVMFMLFSSNLFAQHGIFSKKQFNQVYNSNIKTINIISQQDYNWIISHYQDMNQAMAYFSKVKDYIFYHSNNRGIWMREIKGAIVAPGVHELLGYRYYKVGASDIAYIKKMEKHFRLK